MTHSDVYVYVLEAELHGYLKVGSAKLDNLHTRLAAHQREARYGQVSILGCLRGSRQKEAEIHFILDKITSRVGNTKEWFVINSEVRMLINALHLQPSPPEAHQIYERKNRKTTWVKHPIIAFGEGYPLRVRI